MIRRLFLLACLLFACPARASTTFATNDAQWLASQAYDVAYNNGASYTLPINEGWFSKLDFTGGDYAWTVNLSALSGYGSNFFPVLKYSIDRGPWTRVQLTDGQTTVTFASGLADTTHKAVVILDGLDASSNTNRWAAGLAGLKITGIVVATGKTITASTRLSRNMVVFSDSIGAGQVGLGAVVGGNYAIVCSASLANPQVLSDQWGYELSNVSFPGQGYTTGGVQGGPDVTTSPGFYLNGVARTFTKTYAVCIIQFGTNDTGASDPTVTANVETAIGNIRTLLGASTLIYVNAAFGGYKVSATLTGVTNYQSHNPSDTKVTSYNLSTAGSAIIAANTYEAPTAIHPSSTGEALLGQLNFANFPAPGGALTTTSCSATSITITP